VAPGLRDIGMVCDAIWTDFDNDGWVDLIVVGEWMPVTFFRNDHGKLVNVTARSGVASEIGWWNSITAGDFDNDGDIDYIVGNLGENSFYRAGKTTPVSIYAKDLDSNQSLDALLTLFLPDRDGVLKEFPAASRDEMVRQLPGLKKKFPTYKDYAEATFADLFPSQALADDFDHDGNLDLALSGNDYGNEVTNGRYDAFNGLVLLGDGKGNFRPRTILQSGLYIPGDGKALIELEGPRNELLLAASQNNGPLKVFRSNGDRQIIRLKDDDKVALIYLRTGQVRRQELGYGSSFLSQSARIIGLDKSMLKIEIINGKGERRTITNR